MTWSEDLIRPLERIYGIVQSDSPLHATATNPDRRNGNESIFNFNQTPRETTLADDTPECPDVIEACYAQGARHRDECLW